MVFADFGTEAHAENFAFAKLRCGIPSHIRTENTVDFFFASLSAVFIVNGKITENDELTACFDICGKAFDFARGEHGGVRKHDRFMSEKLVKRIFFHNHIQTEAGSVSRLHTADHVLHKTLECSFREISRSAGEVKRNIRNFFGCRIEAHIFLFKNAVRKLHRGDILAVRGSRIKLTPRTGERPCEINAVGTIGVKHGHRRHASSLTCGITVNGFHHEIHIRLLHDVSIAVFLENEIPEIGAKIERISGRTLFQNAGRIVRAHKLYAERFIKRADITVKTFGAVEFEFFPCDICGIVIVIEKGTPIFGRGQFVARLFLEKFSAMLTGAGVFFTEILDVIVHDAVDSRCHHTFHIIEINSAVIGIVITSGIRAVTVFRVFARTAVDLHEGAEVDAVNAVIIGQEFEDFFPVIVFGCAFGARVKFTFQLFPSVISQNP